MGKSQSQCYSFVRLIIKLVAAFFLILFFVLGCGFFASRKAVPITGARQHSQIEGYSRVIGIPQGDIAYGLTRIFENLAQKYGPFEYEPMVKDYTPMVYRGLYERGYCRIQQLSINDVIVDIDIYFRVDQTPHVMIMDVFTQGSSQPSFSIANQYYLASH